MVHLRFWATVNPLFLSTWPAGFRPLIVSGRDARLVSSEPVWPRCPAGIDPKSEAFLVPWTLHVCGRTRAEGLIDYTSARPDAEWLRLYTTVVLLHASWLNVRRYELRTGTAGTIIYQSSERVYRFLISWWESAHARWKFIVDETKIGFVFRSRGAASTKVVFNMSPVDASVASGWCHRRCHRWKQR